MQAVLGEQIAPRNLPEALKITYSDLQALPQDMNNTRYELFEGECVMTPSPSYRHQNAVMNLIYHISRYIREHRLGKLLSAPCFEREQSIRSKLFEGLTLHVNELWE